MIATSVRIVHGFAVVSPVFWPMIARFRHRSVDASLFRYASVGLPLPSITARLASDLRANPPRGIVAHSLGCVATLLAVRHVGWTGPIVLLAPPFQTLPITRFIPRFLRFPFSPLLDLRAMTTAAGYTPPLPDNCKILTIAGRFDTSVPLDCTRCNSIDAHRTIDATHNSMLFSIAVADACCDWLRSHDGG